MLGMSYDQLWVGQSYRSLYIVSDKDIQTYSELSKDKNPIHLSEDYATKTKFKHRIAHGGLITGFFSGILGTKFPGVGTIYVEQSFKFLKPVYINDHLFFTVRIDKLLNSTKRLVEVKLLVENQSGSTVIEGRAIIKVPKEFKVVN